ncbi:MAG: transposase [Flavobacteriales bacterium]|nr:transposase [Flavobacteriales bacterium]|tara:strand:+ start:5547 stop:5999 length:453 start_codon:yes stop_codon:yes gene_type:complete
MGQSLVQNYVHIIFSTKNHQKLIHPTIENELFNYLGGSCKELGCQPLKVGGYLDHVHILCMLAKNVTIVDLLKNIKSSSSKWIKTKGNGFKDFYWQDGYGSFTVNPSEVDMVSDYIGNQYYHHKKMTFKEEYLKFLKKYKVDFNEKYLWD